MAQVYNRRVKADNVKYDAYIGGDTKCTVEFDYSAAEEPIYYGPLAHPGCDASVDIYAVWINDDDIYQDLNEECLGQFEQDCLDHVHLIGIPERERDYD